MEAASVAVIACCCCCCCWYCGSPPLRNCIQNLPGQRESLILRDAAAAGPPPTAAAASRPGCCCFGLTAEGSAHARGHSAAGTGVAEHRSKRFIHRKALTKRERQTESSVYIVSLCLYWVSRPQHSWSCPFGSSKRPQKKQQQGTHDVRTRERRLCCREQRRHKALTAATTAPNGRDASTAAAAANASGVQVAAAEISCSSNSTRCSNRLPQLLPL